jgi:hypothetical protein
MKRPILLSAAFAVSICLSGLPLMSQGRSGGMGPSGGMGQGPGMGPAQAGQNDPTARRPTMGEPGMDRTNTNQTMPRMKTPDQLLSQNTKLSSKVQTLLPDGTKVQDAASGFKDLGEFVAAVHISKNLNIPFDQYKDKVTGGDSLGKALKALNPSLTHKQIKSEVKKGKEQAKADIKSSHQS